MAMISSITEARSNRRERPIRSAPGVSGGHIFRSDLIPETGDAESDTPNCKLIEQQAHGVDDSRLRMNRAILPFFILSSFVNLLW